MKYQQPVLIIFIINWKMIFMQYHISFPQTTFICNNEFILKILKTKWNRIFVEFNWSVLGWPNFLYKIHKAWILPNYNFWFICNKRHENNRIVCSMQWYLRTYMVLSQWSVRESMHGSPILASHVMSYLKTEIVTFFAV